jgi:predicted ATP-dependent endonuclease of OLD family
MRILKNIEINNFRSISKLSGAISRNHLNILVGQNDVGVKFFESLELVFNNETEIGVPFRFADDFSRYAIVP